MKPLILRFLKYVKRNGACLEWIGALDHKGYGRLTVENSPVSVHRLAYVLFIGPIPAKLHVLHKCDNRKCINPAHFFPGTNSENVSDRQSKLRQAVGARHGMSKLSEEDKKEILVLIGYGKTRREIAKILGVGHGTINYHINKGKK